MQLRVRCPGVHLPTARTPEVSRSVIKQLLRIMLRIMSISDWSAVGKSIVDRLSVTYPISLRRQYLSAGVDYVVFQMGHVSDGTYMVFQKWR